jgi:hypothetical protein
VGDVDSVHFQEGSGGSPCRKSQIDVVCKAKPHDVGGEIPESKISSAFGQGRQIHLKVVDGEFPVDVMELEFMLVLPVFGKIFWR